MLNVELPEIIHGEGEAIFRPLTQSYITRIIIPTCTTEGLRLI